VRKSLSDETQRRNESKCDMGNSVLGLFCTMAPSLMLAIVAAEERICWDPKDGELYINIVKLGENLMEACVIRN